MKRDDLTGKVFGRLTVVGFAESKMVGDRKRVFWRCRCECGRMKSVGSDPLKAGTTASCGCLLVVSLQTRSITHGHRRGRKASREIKSWSHAKSRCYCTTDAKYPIYGGRGITMCQEWRDSFQAFFDYMGPAPEGMTLDRIDVNGNYEPGNCRWASTKEQANNTRANVMVTAFGETMTMKQMAENHGVPYKTLHFRVKYRDQGVEEAILALQTGKRAPRAK